MTLEVKDKNILVDLGADGDELAIAAKILGKEELLYKVLGDCFKSGWNEAIKWVDDRMIEGLAKLGENDDAV